MGRGSSKAGGGKSGARSLPREVTEVETALGRTVHLDSPLIYGDKDAIFHDGGYDNYIRGKVEASIADLRTERPWYWDSYGEGTGTFVRGDEDSARTSFTRSQAQSVVGMTHNHPRMSQGDDEVLGGTFSSGVNGGGDMNNFCSQHFPNYTTMRAGAHEGTYSISKTSNFRRSLGSQYTRASNRNYAAAFEGFDAIRRQWRSGNMSDSDFYSQKARRMNNWLVADHNWLLANQDKYGYTYTLERR